MTGLDNSSLLIESLRHKIQMVVVGASAGGVEAMLSLFKSLPPTFSISIVAVLHMPENRDSNLANVFQHWVAIPVKEAADKERIMPGILYFAPPSYHLSIESELTFSLSCEPPVNYSRPAIDILMESAAQAYKENLLGIVLTGANHDGARGLMAIKSFAGVTVVQDPKEAQSKIMPQEAINFQKPDFVLVLDEIKDMLLKLGEIDAY